ncbi:hypothetical protein Taro_051828, partial [Colocasia esculenta]|nr:hypothetical protein [Colocasia esculenta]
MKKAEITTHPCKGRDGISQITTASYEDRDGSFGQAARTRQGSLSRSDRNRYLCRDGPENVAYRAIACSGLELEELGMKLDEAFSPQILLLLGLSSRSRKPQQR